ncbi:MAG: hypothetical protein J7M34_08535, partial [Anaerolineae bacterium]|nr:hypothetical protein [Anaerolineae bacterium]
YPDRSFTENDLKRLYNVDLADHKGDVFFIKFDAELEPVPDAVEHISPDEVRANLVNPAVWNRAMELAAQALGQSQLGTLIFGSALNLLLFSRTYGEQMFAKLESLLRGEKQDTYLFTVSSNALQEKIRALEKAADHLLLAESAKSPQGGPELRLRVARLRGASHSDEVAVVPFDSATLEEMRQAADASRVRRIPAIRNI